MLPVIFIPYALSSGQETRSSRTGRDIENNVASEVHVRRFKPKEVGIKKKQVAFVILCVDGSLRNQERRAQRQTLRHPRAESFDAGGVSSSLDEAGR